MTLRAFYVPVSFSRLEARTNDKGEAVLFDEKDRSLWDKSLIERGNYYLISATSGNEIQNIIWKVSIRPSTSFSA